MIWWLAVLFRGVLTLPVCPNQQKTPKDHVVLSALLPLHSGDDCAETQIRGLQQLAALEYGLGKVNADLGQYGDVKISLQALDTCSSPGVAVKATMKGLVSAEQTCIRSPLLLGYVGPDDPETFVNVHKVTSLLNKTHVLPYQINLKEKPTNVFFIGTDQTGIRAKTILTMLKNLGWESYSSVVEESTQIINLLDTLADLSDGQICPVEKPILLPKTANEYTNVYKGIMEIHTSIDGILVIVEKPEALKPLLKILSNSASVQRPPFVVYMFSVGLKLWELPRSDTLKMVIMQEATEFKARNEIKQYFNDSLLISYHEQTRTYKRNCENDPMCLDSLEDELDSTVMPIVYSVHLFANALRMSLDQKCKHGSGYLEICRNLQYMPAAEWMSVLRTASTIMNGPEGPKRVRFQMETMHHVSLYMWNAIARNFDLIGTMTNGDRLSFVKNVFLPTSIRAAVRSGRAAVCRPLKTNNVPKTTEKSPAEEEATRSDKAATDDWSPIWDFLPTVDKNSSRTKDTYNVMAVMLCVGLGFLAFMIVTIRMLYGLFKFKQGDEERASASKGRRSNTAARRKKRQSSVTSRRMSRSSSVVSARSA